MMGFAFQLLVAGLCLTGPVFNTQFGIVFWLVTAAIHGALRTLQDAELHAEWQQEDFLEHGPGGGSRE
jgi:hypothetical protein